MQPASVNSVTNASFKLMKCFGGSVGKSTNLGPKNPSECLPYVTEIISLGVEKKKSREKDLCNIKSSWCKEPNFLLSEAPRGREGKRSRGKRRRVRSERRASHDKD